MSLSILLNEEYGHPDRENTGVLIGKYARTAMEDLPCLKLLRKERGRYYSYYRGSEYVPGQSYKSKINGEQYSEHLTIGKALHAYKTVPQPLRLPENVVIGEFVIPKGAMYFEDSYDNDVASTQLKFVREITDGNNN